MTTSEPLPPDVAVDLHLHTRYSDGSWRPADLFAALEQGGFCVVSVVDHDQMEHLPEVAALGAERGIIVIPGTEVTTEWRGLAAHLLCYAPLATGFTSDALRAVVDDTRARMLANSQMIYDQMLARGYRFPRQQEVLASRDGRLNRAMDVGTLLLAHGYADGPGEAMRMVNEAGYQQALAPIEQAVAAAHASGALCVLAHPGRGEGEIHRYEPAEIEALLAEVPLEGVEVYYPTHSTAQVAAYEALAARHGLLTSAGSDSHAPSTRQPIPYPARRIAPLLQRLGVPLKTAAQ
jgi:predicted metal-dependent phosphoesterase TrpH